MLTAPPARGTSLNFLARRLPRLNANDGVLSYSNLLLLILIRNV